MPAAMRVRVCVYGSVYTCLVGVARRSRHIKTSGRKKEEREAIEQGCALATHTCTDAQTQTRSGLLWVAWAAGRVEGGGGERQE